MKPKTKKSIKLLTDTHQEQEVDIFQQEFIINMVEVKDGKIIPRKNLHPSCTENSETRARAMIPQAAARFFSAHHPKNKLDKSASSHESLMFKIRKGQSKTFEGSMYSTLIRSHSAGFFYKPPQQKFSVNYTSKKENTNDVGKYLKVEGLERKSIANLSSSATNFNKGKSRSYTHLN